VRQSGICTVAKDTNLLLLPFLKCGQTIIDSAISEKMKITSSEGSWPAYVDGDTIRIVDCKKKRQSVPPLVNKPILLLYYTFMHI
jgi:hypothetical protein